MHVLDRQRPAPQFVARRRHDAVPQREEHQLGRRVPHPAARSLAGQDQGGLDLQRDRPASRLAADVPRDGRRPRRRRKAQEGLQGDRPHVQEPHRRLQPAAVPDRARKKQSPRKFFFYISDDGDVLGDPRYDNWKVVFMEQRVPRHACRCGPSRSRGCACPRSSTFAPTRTSSPTSRRTPTGTG